MYGLDTVNLKRMERYRRMIDTLMGGGFADLVLKGGQIINVITREIYEGDVAIQDDYILMAGDCKKLIGPKTRVMEMRGKFISPGFIDSHMHFESSMLTVSEFERLSLPSGTTTLIADPHEIANVAGNDGMFAMIEEAETLPGRVLFTVPCLTPDVPGLETAGAEINSGDMEKLMSEKLVKGIGEMQGFSNVRPVYEHTPELLDDLLKSSFTAEQVHKTVEGNAPSLFGAELAAHIIVCGGETSCHETTTKEECVEKLRQGVTVFMREGSTQKNMSECIKAVTEEGLDSRRLVLATDDMVAEDLINKGHMNEIIKRVISRGVDPVEAIQMATINAATHYGLRDTGVIAPGKAADLAIISDLRTMKVDIVLLSGEVVAQNSRLSIDIPHYSYPKSVKNTVKRKRVSAAELAVASSKSSETVRGIVIVPDQNLTETFTDSLSVNSGFVEPAPEKDVLPLIVAERHGKTGDIGKTFVKGLGLKSGAIALSVAHDTHNIIACGANYDDLAMAVNRVIALSGGIAMIKDGKVVGDLPLPVAGLITDELSGPAVCKRLKELHSTAKQELGCTLHAPFMHLSFLSLVTSPKYKITDKGLVDVEKYEVVSTLL